MNSKFPLMLPDVLNTQHLRDTICKSTYRANRLIRTPAPNNLQTIELQVEIPLQ